MPSILRGTLGSCNRQLFLPLESPSRSSPRYRTSSLCSMVERSLPKSARTHNVSKPYNKRGRTILRQKKKEKKIMNKYKGMETSTKSDGSSHADLAPSSTEGRTLNSLREMTKNIDKTLPGPVSELSELERSMTEPHKQELPPNAAVLSTNMEEDINFCLGDDTNKETADVETNIFSRWTGPMRPGRQILWQEINRLSYLAGFPSVLGNGGEFEMLMPFES